MCFAVLDPLFSSCLELVLAGPANFIDSQVLSQLEHLMKCVSLHAQAFGKGLISLQRLLDVLVNPFFRVAETVNLMPLSSQERRSEDFEFLRRLRSQLLSDWAGCLRKALIGAVVGGGDRIVLDLPHSKRADMMRGFTGANVFKVLDVHSTSVHLSRFRPRITDLNCGLPALHPVLSTTIGFMKKVEARVLELTVQGGWAEYTVRRTLVHVLCPKPSQMQEI